MASYYYPDEDGIFPADGEIVMAWTKDMEPPCHALHIAHDEYGWYGKDGYPIKGDVRVWTPREHKFWKDGMTHIERKGGVPTPIMSWTDENGTKRELLLREN